MSLNISLPASRFRPSRVCPACLASAGTSTSYYATPSRPVQQRIIVPDEEAEKVLQLLILCLYRMRLLLKRNMRAIPNWADGCAMTFIRLSTFTDNMYHML